MEIFTDGRLSKKGMKTTAHFDFFVATLAVSPLHPHIPQPFHCMPNGKSWEGEGLKTGNLPYSRPLQGGVIE